MKILYQLILKDDESFKAKDFPDRFEILRKGKPPLVFKPVAIRTREIYSRLNEAEELLRQAKGLNEIFKVNSDGGGLHFKLETAIDQYFERHEQ